MPSRQRPFRSVVPDGQGGHLLGRRPAFSAVCDAEDSAALNAAADTVQSWFRRGCVLVVGAVAYDTGGTFPRAGHQGSPVVPGLVMHGYQQTEAVTPVTLSKSPWQLTEPFRAGVSRADYLRSLARISAYLRAGDCYQVNLAQHFHGRYRGDPLAGWARLASAHDAPFAGFTEWPGGALLSASPERFLRIDGNVVTTEPIKGSRPRGTDPQEDARLGQELRDSAKDRAENLMIVDLLRNDLGRFCETGSIEVEELFGLRRFSNVQHLVSTIRGRLRAGIAPLDALLSAFPGGSVTGAPKKRAMEVIAELEPVPRGFYCGSLFWQTGPETLDSSILIRTLRADGDGGLHCHGGGGIVMDSDPEAEYEESLFKVRALMEVMGNDP